MSKLCVIPARGGSKRILRKNIKDFLGKPIIAYSIEIALNSNFFDEVIVSTDDEEIAKIATDFGAKVPFFRSKKNADDHAVLADVVLEVIENYKSLQINFDQICCILPTAPFINKSLLKQAKEKLQNFSSVFPVLEFSFPIQRSLLIENEKVRMLSPEYMHTRSQDLPKRYHDAGQFYWLNVSSFLKEKKLFMKNSSAIVISELAAQDIDTEIDWKIAELKYKLLNEVS